MPLVRISVLRGKPAQVRRRLGDAVHAALVNLVEVPRENWSFGNGLASYAPAEQAA